MILDQRAKIDEFIRDALRVKKGTKNKTRKNKRKGG
jgi:hypothetical protein